jgi:hypothetical protein
VTWHTGLTDDQLKKMRAITANVNHTKTSKPRAKYLRVENGAVVEHERPSRVVSHSMFPYKSTSMAVDPQEVEHVQEQLRRQGVFAEFDQQGRPIITSTKQHAALATAMGMKTGRDGYGHLDEHGNFQNSGRRRNDEVQEGRSRVRKAREKLQAMPEDVPAHVVQNVLDEYDIAPTEENTG